MISVVTSQVNYKINTGTNVRIQATAPMNVIRMDCSRPNEVRPVLFKLHIKTGVSHTPISNINTSITLQPARQLSIIFFILDRITVLRTYTDILELLYGPAPFIAEDFFCARSEDTIEKHTNGL